MEENEGPGHGRPMNKLLEHLKGHIAILAVFAAVVASLIALNVSFRRALQMEMAEQFNKQQLLLSNGAASDIQEYVRRMEREMENIAGLVSTLGARDRAHFAKLARGLFSDAGSVNKVVRLLDREGRVLYQSGTLTGEAAGNKDIPGMSKRLCPAGTVVAQDTKRLHLITPVCDSDGVSGAVEVYVDIQSIATQFLIPIKSGARGYAWMMDDKGDLLHHPTRPDMVGRNLYRTNSSCFGCHKSFDIERRIIEGKGDFYGRYVAPSGEDKVLAFSTASIGDMKWIVAVSAPYSEVTMPIRRAMRLYSWVVVCLFLITGTVSVVSMLFYRKKMKAEELERNREQLEKQARDLESEVSSRTAELSDEKEKLNTIVEAMGSGILLIDTGGTIQWTNRMMKQIAGKDITGMLCRDIYQDCTIMGSWLTEGVQTEMLTNLFGKKDVYFQVTTAPVKGEKGALHGYIRLMQDVTATKKMQEQMMHSEKLASLARLTSGIACEMANPPTSVFSFVQMLKEMEQDEFKKESLETTYFHMKRIADVLKQVSSFSMTPPEEFKACKVNSLIESSLSLIQYDSGAKDITIVRDLRPDIPEIVTDGNLLSQVIVNIVLNAIDAMPRGGTLMVRSRLEKKDIVIDFEDTGVGIPGENLGRIFDPFYTTKEKGTGLGLAVSQDIIKRLNASLKVESKVGRGSRFEITFPRDEEPFRR